MKFCIVHFNTPVLTKCLLASIRRNHPNDDIIIFDNSDKCPLGPNRLVNECYDNTKGSIINFKKELARFPNRDIDTQTKVGVNFGSAKHAMSIEWLCNNVGSDFILLDSDVLLKRPIDFIDTKYACICEIYKNVDGSKLRCSPMLCYLNVPKLNKLGISYFDPNRMLGLNKYNSESMKYDTGSSLYEDLFGKSLIKQIIMNDYIEHYGNGSWTLPTRRGITHTTLSPTEWLFVNKHYFMDD